MEDAKRQELIGAYIAAYNAFDIEGMAALLSPDICFENYSGEERSHATRGIEEFRQLAASWETTTQPGSDPLKEKPGSAPSAPNDG